MYNALMHLCHTTEPRVHQGDTLERNQQVSQIAQVYSSAIVVIVWLGALGDDKASMCALEFLQADVKLGWSTELRPVTIFGFEVI